MYKLKQIQLYIEKKNETILLTSVPEHSIENETFPIKIIKS